MDERHYVQVALASIDGGEGDSGEEGDKGKAGVGQVSHRKDRSGQEQGTDPRNQGAQHSQTEALQHELLHERPTDIDRDRIPGMLQSPETVQRAGKIGDGENRQRQQQVAPSSHDSRINPRNSSPRERALLAACQSCHYDVPHGADSAEDPERQGRPESHLKQRYREKKPQRDGGNRLSDMRLGRAPQSHAHRSKDAETLFECFTALPEARRSLRTLAAIQNAAATRHCGSWPLLLQRLDLGRQIGRLPLVAADRSRRFCHPRPAARCAGRG